MLGSPLDWEALVRRCMGRADLAERIVQQFCAGLDERLAELEKTIESSDQEETIRLAHRLKGTSLTVSAEDLAGSAGRIEEAARRGELNRLNGLFDDLHAARDRLMDNLAQFRTKAVSCVR